jgi:hypothetical protein
MSSNSAMASARRRRAAPPQMTMQLQDVFTNNQDNLTQDPRVNKRLTIYDAIRTVGAKTGDIERAVAKNLSEVYAILHQQQGVVEELQKAFVKQESVLSALSKEFKVYVEILKKENAAKKTVENADNEDAELAIKPALSLTNDDKDSNNQEEDGIHVEITEK